MSLRRIARTLGLSITTVSRALGGFDDVAAATRARVREEAARIGYQPNRAAQSLRQGRAGAIGVVLPTPPGHFGDPFFLRLLAAIGPLLARAGLDLLVMAAPPGAEEMRAYRHLVESRRIDGMLVARTRVEDERVAWLQAQGMPFVTNGRTAAASPHAWVDVDGAGAFRTAVRRLATRGHRRIALLNAPDQYFFARDRAAGWRDGLEAAGLPEAPMRAAEPSEENGHRLAAELLALPEPPTALLCATDRLAVGALHAIADSGRVAGRDVAVIGYDDLPAAGWVSPALTTFAQPHEAAATHALDFLLRRIAGEDPASLHMLLAADLVARASDPPRAREKQEAQLEDPHAESPGIRPS